MGIFDKRVAFKPFEYPDVVGYKDAINHSYWLVSEWNFISDVHEFNIKLDETQKNVIRNALLAISQIEISVKTFWTKLGDRFPKAEFTQVGVTFGECHVEGTEILTPTGWKDFKDINVGDEVIQYKEDGTLQITKVQNKTEENYNGDIHKIYKESFEARITPNHKIAYFDHKNNFKKTCIKDLGVKNSNNKLPEAGKLEGGKDNLTWEERLFIALQADDARQIKGVSKEYNTYEITVKKERKKNRIREILSHLGYVNREFNDQRPGYLKLEIDVPTYDFNYKDFDWIDLTDKSYKWCEEFVQEIAEWNGTRISNKKYCSTNKNAVDKVQMVGLCAGYKCNINKYEDVYTVSFIQNREKTSFSPLKEDIIPYNGKIYCVTVDSGVIVTRYNNSTFISGNSEVRHSDAYSHLLEVLGLNDDFTMLLQNPVIEGRVDYLTKYLKGASENSNENYTLTLTLFSIFIENVSLFSQFVIIKSFNKYLNILKDIDNVVQATQQEESIHALFGVYLINQIKKEHPEWFNEDFYNKLQRACKKAFDAECKIIDWIFEKGELDFLPKDVVVEFIKNRFNESLDMIGAEQVFDVDKEKLDHVKWFNDELYAFVNTDFFHKKPVTYSKFLKSYTAEDLF